MWKSVWTTSASVCALSAGACQHHGPCCISFLFKQIALFVKCVWLAAACELRQTRWLAASQSLLPEIYILFNHFSQPNLIYSILIVNDVERRSSTFVWFRMCSCVPPVTNCIKRCITEAEAPKQCFIKETKHQTAVFIETLLWFLTCDHWMRPEPFLILNDI